MTEITVSRAARRRSRVRVVRHGLLGFAAGLCPVGIVFGLFTVPSPNPCLPLLDPPGWGRPAELEVAAVLAVALAWPAAEVGERVVARPHSPAGRPAALASIAVVWCCALGPMIAGGDWWPLAAARRIDPDGLPDAQLVTVFALWLADVALWCAALLHTTATSQTLARTRSDSVPRARLLRAALVWAVAGLAFGGLLCWVAWSNPTRCVR
jgi:hypothetical protein